ncbi:MAG TPA: D-arabinono-1,4-lactone oxidase [Aeromicrobium sp.]|nr:D-arabinono-1,4-lactone oxidase [Aeromicrobium sp.]
MTTPPQMTWRNWTGDEACESRRIERPRSADELSEVVAAASATGQGPIRAVGAGHSFGDIVCTDGVLISLDNLFGLLRYDEVTGYATVAAGTRLFQLNSLLDEVGRAMANLGDINVQSVAGAISTATHGTGARLGNLATQVVALDIVTADGSVRTVNAGDDLMASRVSLGALGIISAVTLRTVPEFRLHGVDERRPLEETLLRLDEFTDVNEHFEFWAFPHTDHALCRTNNRTDEPARVRGRVAAYVNDTVLENRVLDLVSTAGRRFPRQIPRLNRLVTRAFSETDRVDIGHQIFSSVRDVRFTESEWAVPADAAPSMVREIFDVIDKRGFDVNFPLEVRFVARDEDSFLSPSWGRDTSYIAAHMYRGMEWEPFLRAVQDVALAHAGRPHWGKRHFLAADELASKYPEWDRFQDVRSEFDPDRVFTNDHVSRVLG